MPSPFIHMIKDRHWELLLQMSMSLAFTTTLNTFDVSFPGTDLLPTSFDCYFTFSLKVIRAIYPLLSPANPLGLDPFHNPFVVFMLSQMIPKLRIKILINLIVVLSCWSYIGSLNSFCATIFTLPKILATLL